MQGASFPSCLQVTEHTISDVSSAARSWELDSWEMATRHRQGEGSKAHSAVLWDSMMPGENCEFPISLGSPRPHLEALT